MRSTRMPLAFVLMIFAFPPLIALASGTIAISWAETVIVELIVATGLILAARFKALALSQRLVPVSLRVSRSPLQRARAVVTARRAA